MAREIDLSSDVLLSRHNGALDILRSISRMIPDSDWCVIGGLVTYLVLREHSVGLDSRASQTKDADVVVEVTTGSGARVVHGLVSIVFTQLERFFGQTEGQARYRMGATLVDVLAPHDTAASDLLLNEHTATLAAPGGRRALELATPVTVYYGSEGFAEFRVPNIGHAVVVKAAAVLDPKTASQRRHLEDVVELLRALDDPTIWAVDMTGHDRNLLDRIAPDVEAAGDLEAITALELLARATS